LAQDRRRKIKKARQRLVLWGLMIDIMRTVHGAYAPGSEPFGTRLETFFIALCVTLGDIDGKPFSVAKIAAYMRVPRTTVIRRLERLQGWGQQDDDQWPSCSHSRRGVAHRGEHRQAAGTDCVGMPATRRSQTTQMTGSLRCSARIGVDTPKPPQEREGA
jgi:hypothetical protein